MANILLMSFPTTLNPLLYLFLYSIPSNLAISIYPHEPVVIYFGTFSNLWIIAALATAATCLAGYLDYQVFEPLFNLQSIERYKKKRWYRSAIDHFFRYPFATIVVAGFTPIPFFPFKFLAFSTQYPLSRYLASLAVGRFPRYYLLALTGSFFHIPRSLLIGSLIFLVALYVIVMGPGVFRRLGLQWRRSTRLDEVSS